MFSAVKEPAGLNPVEVISSNVEASADLYAHKIFACTIKERDAHTPHSLFLALFYLRIKIFSVRLFWKAVLTRCGVSEEREMRREIGEKREGKDHKEQQNDSDDSDILAQRPPGHHSEAYHLPYAHSKSE